MAGEQIEDVLVRDFLDNFHMKAQQTMARTLPYVELLPIAGDDAAYDDFGAVQDEEIKGRNQKITFADGKFGRRKLSRKRFGIALPIDESDVRGMLTNPESKLMSAALAAFNRRKDRVVVDAAFADVLTGKEFGTTVTAASDGVQTVDATAGATYEKLLELQENFIKKEVPLGNIGLLQSEQEHTAFMGETELTSGDFRISRPVEGGRMETGLGMDFVLFGSDPNGYDPILEVNASSERRCVAIARKDDSAGIALGISKDITMKLEPRPDMWETMQLKVIMEIGAVRTEGALVQEFKTTAT